jgi:hypothetical protein
MIELSDPTLQFFVVSIVSVLSLFVAIVTFFKTRTKKALSYEIDYREEFDKVDAGLKEEVKQLYPNKDLRKSVLLRYKLTNKGNTPLTFSDFNQPISFIFKEDVEILKAKIWEPECDRKAITAEKNRVIIKPSLINPKESFIFSVFATKPSEVTLNYRIIGVHKIEEIIPNSKIMTLIFIFTFFNIGTLILNNITKWSFLENLTQTFLWINYAIIGSLVVFIFYDTWKKSKQENPS